MQLRRSFPALTLSILLLSMMPSTLIAGIFDDPENLEVLPEDISAAELRDVMRGFAMSTGLRCNDCHVGRPGQDLADYDFASDRKKHKRIARDMLRMVASINDELLAEMDVDEDERVMVTCVTCHRGQDRPRMLADHLVEALQEDGVDGMTERYQELRERHYGSHTFDFSETGVLGITETLAEIERIDAAIALVRLNIRDIPRPVWSHVSLAQLLAATGEVEAAKQELLKALEYEPDNPQVRAMLERFGG